MKEYIERGVALKLREVFSDRENGNKDFLGGIETAIEFLQNIPAADVVEVRHGKNLSEDDPSIFECSECGWKCRDTYYGDTITYSFCPNCGAKMDKEE